MYLYIIDLCDTGIGFFFIKLHNQIFRFNCQPYRESGVSILSGVDDIQVQLN